MCLTFVVNTAVGFVAVAGVALIQLSIFKAPATFLLQWEVEEGLGLNDVLVTDLEKKETTYKSKYLVNSFLRYTVILEIHPSDCRKRLIQLLSHSTSLCIAAVDELVKRHNGNIGSFRHDWIR
jgi:hypothetical protein